jgi:peptide/nickel transport system substrate-binding protein
VEQNLDIHVYDPVVQNVGGKIVPRLAESWKQLTPTSYRFTLRKGVKFHNGDAFNAECVKFSFDRINDPEVKSDVKGQFVQVDKVNIVDPYTVDVVLKSPMPLFLKMVSDYVFIASPKYISTKGIGPAAIEPVGTGAFRFVEWVKGDHVTFEANKEYWGGAPKFDTLTFTTLPQPASRVAALRTGEVDVVIDLDPAAYKELQGVSGINVASVPGYRNIYLLINSKLDTPFRKKAVRQAVNYAIDKEALVKNILEGHGTPLQGQPYSSMWLGYLPDYKMIPYDPAKARQLLADAGYPNGLDTEFISPTGRYLKDKELSEAIVGQLAKVGIRCKLTVAEWANYMQRFMAYTIGPLALTGQANGTIDSMANWNDYFWSPGLVTCINMPEFDAIYEKARVEPDEAKRLELVKRGNKLLADEAANGWLHQQHDTFGMRTRVQWTPPNNQLLDFRQATVS